jgi:hypothetical protein
MPFDPGLAVVAVQIADRGLPGDPALHPARVGKSLSQVSRAQLETLSNRGTCLDRLDG